MCLYSFRKVLNITIMQVYSKVPTKTLLNQVVSLFNPLRVFRKAVLSAPTAHPRIRRNWRIFQTIWLMRVSWFVLDVGKLEVAWGRGGHPLTVFPTRECSEVAKGCAKSRRGMLEAAKKRLKAGGGLAVVLVCTTLSLHHHIS